MKIYTLTNHTGTIFVSDLIETEKYYLVPIKDNNNFDSYSKDVFKLEVLNVEQQCGCMGFAHKETIKPL